MYVFAENGTLFSNQVKKSSNVTLAPSNASTTKRPYITHAEDLFAQSHCAQLWGVIKLLWDKSVSPSHTGKENLALYHIVKVDAYSALPESNKAKWQAQAAEHNEHIKHLTSMEHIFEYEIHI